MGAAAGLWPNLMGLDGRLSWPGLPPAIRARLEAERADLAASILATPAMDDADRLVQMSTLVRAAAAEAPPDSEFIRLFALWRVANVPAPPPAPTRRRRSASSRKKRPSRAG
ncbi:hypothetical protein [Azospirillum sp. ST 5-10]|uniref:hypothetical protein n=1 Tax=unclassified Azospirillum TaxID=2630922 RepID=UPI003F49C13D